MLGAIAMLVKCLLGDFNTRIPKFVDSERRKSDRT